jgi:hypothetical protein
MKINKYIYETTMRLYVLREEYQEMMMWQYVEQSFFNFFSQKTRVFFNFQPNFPHEKAVSFRIFLIEFNTGHVIEVIVENCMWK